MWTDDDDGNPRPYCHRDFALVQMCLYLSLPLLLTLDIAATSNRCDHLMDQLNAMSSTAARPPLAFFSCIKSAPLPAAASAASASAGA